MSTSSENDAKSPLNSVFFLTSDSYGVRNEGGKGMLITAVSKDKV